MELIPILRGLNPHKMGILSRPLMIQKLANYLNFNIINIANLIGMKIAKNGIGNMRGG